MNRFCKICLFLLIFMLLTSCGTSSPSVQEQSSVAEVKAESKAQTTSPDLTVVQEPVQVPDKSSKLQEQPPQESQKREDSNPSEDGLTAPSPSIAVAIPDEFVHCETKIDEDGSLYTAQAAGPTLEEARDNAVDEACAIPCAEHMEKQTVSEDEAENQLEACIDRCAQNTIVLAAACYLKGQSIYTEGAWNENGDPAPTNGEESTEIPQEQ